LAAFEIIGSEVMVMWQRSYDRLKMDNPNYEEASDRVRMSKT